MQVRSKEVIKILWDRNKNLNGKEKMISYLVCHEAVECEGALTVDSVLAYHIPPRPCRLVLRLEPK